MKIENGRLYHLCGCLIEWIYDHVEDDAEFERVLTEHIGMTVDEVEELGFDFDKDEEEYVEDDGEYEDMDEEDE